MLLRTVSHIPHKGTVLGGTLRRCVSGSSSKFNNGNKPTSEGAHQVEEANKPASGKIDYPKIRLEPEVVTSMYNTTDDPSKRVAQVFRHEGQVYASMWKGTAPSKTTYESDILIVGGGIVGSAIAYELTKKAGPALSVAVVEKDPPDLSTSLPVGHNSLYQQVKLKPLMEMAQYSFDFYRELSELSDPDSHGINFRPCSSLLLASENEARFMEERSKVYSELRWQHQLLTPSMLKQKFPWMDVEGVAVGCLGMHKEGSCNELNAVHAMRNAAKKCNVQFIQGEVIGFTFLDQSDFYSGSQYNRFHSPRRVTIQTPTGDTVKHNFSIVILATGSSTENVRQLLDGNDFPLQAPIKSYDAFSFEFHCSDGPGIEMPMIMEENGLRFRKADIIDSYYVWEEKSLNERAAMPKINPDTYFTENLLPQLIKRVPTFKNAKLLSSTSGKIDSCTWDENVLVGPVPWYYNVYIAGGFDNDEFLLAPGAAQAISELILERDYGNIKLECFTPSRIASGIKINEICN